jgi:two-component system, response regulator, stage 0 sporulation protein F
MPSPSAILCVEDDIDILNCMELILTGEGYEVHRAENGRVAYEMLTRFPPNQLPDAIVLDLMMPEMNGGELLALLHRDHPNDLARIPVLIASAMGNPNEQLKGLPRTFERLSKPMDLDELLAKVAKSCKKAIEG